MNQKWVVGNWKMNGEAEASRSLVNALLAVTADSPPKAEVILCPPDILLRDVSRMLQGSPLKLGGQDCHANASGAHTGDTSASMLKEAGCAYVIVGHSERRAAYGETNAQVLAKAKAAIQVGLVPIICVGETQAERAAGNAVEVVKRQAAESATGLDTGAFLLAYEPVWAIGSGQTPTVADIAAMHAVIHHVLGIGAKVLYGGSVNAANAAEILGLEGVSGVLVGGASLKADAFGAIMKAA